MKVERLIKEFLEHTRIHRKPSTLRHYRGRLRLFRKICGSKRLKRINPSVIERYLRRANHWRDGRPKAADTRRSNIVVLETMFRFAMRMQYLKSVPFDRLEKPPSRKRERIPTAAEDAAIEQLSSPAFHRIFTALRRTGARPGELANALISDYRVDPKMIVLADHKTAGKVGRPRKIGIGEKLAPVIADAIAGRTDGPIFLDDCGRQWTVQKLSRTYRTLRDRAGLDRELCLYCQRHSVGTKVTREKGVAAAAQILGHADIKMTASRYVHFDDSEMAQNLDAID